MKYSMNSGGDSIYYLYNLDELKTEKKFEGHLKEIYTKIIIFIHIIMNLK